jgi:hypothetical protein
MPESWVTIDITGSAPTDMEADSTDAARATAEPL